MTIAVVVLPFVALLTGLVAVLAVLRSQARPDGTLAREIASARRHAVVCSALSGIAAVATLALVPTMLKVSLGRVPSAVVGCLPLLATTTALAVLLVGEATWPRPRGRTRTARLHDRSLGAVLGSRWARATAVVSVLLAVTLVVCGLLADGGGHSVSRATATGSSTAGPFPGWMYGVPQLLALGLCLALALQVARAATRRSTVVSADLETDLLLRRASAVRAARAVLAGALLTLGPDLGYAGLTARNAYGSSAISAVFVALVLLGLVTTLSVVAVLVLPVPRLAAPPAAPAAQPASR